MRALLSNENCIGQNDKVLSKRKDAALAFNNCCNLYKAIVMYIVSQWIYIIVVIVINPRSYRERMNALQIKAAKVVLKNFAKFTGKQLCQSLFFNKVAGLNFSGLFQKQTLVQLFSFELCGISPFLQYTTATVFVQDVFKVLSKHLLWCIFVKIVNDFQPLRYFYIKSPS